MSIAENLSQINTQIGNKTRLIAVTKTKPIELLLEAYNAGCKRFGENKVQEMVEKYHALPKDIEWHLIGHLQTNKVKLIAPFVSMIHSVDSLKLLQEINKYAAQNNRVIDCLLQIDISHEDTKYGLSESEAVELLNDSALSDFQNVCIKGVMGMASNTLDQNKIRGEFKNLKHFFDQQSAIESPIHNVDMQEISMGMSGDYAIATDEGSTLVRVGSAIFGSR